MTEYKEVEFYAGCSVEEAMRTLLIEEKELGPVKGKFNGKWLYSDKDNIDSAYMKVLGQTQAEHRQYMIKEADRIERERAEHESSIPELTEHYIQVGHDMLSKDKWEYWEQVVPARLRDLYQGLDLKSFIEVEKLLLSGGTLEEAKDMIYNQGHSGMSFAVVKEMLKEFSYRGDEIYHYLSK